jgi:hypothetical protein
MRIMPGEILSVEAAAPGLDSQTGRELAITPELVKEVADRVLGLLLQDLRIENERRRPSPRESLGVGRSWQ